MQEQARQKTANNRIEGRERQRIGRSRPQDAKAVGELSNRPAKQGGGTEKEAGSANDRMYCTKCPAQTIHREQKDRGTHIVDCRTGERKTNADNKPCPCRRCTDTVEIVVAAPEEPAHDTEHHPHRIAYHHSISHSFRALTTYSFANRN